jgi:hypothetical protein
MLTTATVERDGRLVLTKGRHRLNWLGSVAARPQLVVENVDRGCLRVTSLDIWAKERNMTPDEALAAIGELALRTRGTSRLPGVGLVEAERKGSRGSPVYRVRMPAPALAALFPKGDGPMASKFERESRGVPVRTEEDGIFLWSADFEQHLATLDAGEE